MPGVPTGMYTFGVRASLKAGVPSTIIGISVSGGERSGV